MYETSPFNWIEAAVNFLWILGAAIILAALSYWDYTRHASKKRGGWRASRPGESLKKALLAGSTLIAAGVSATVKNPLLAIVFAAAGCALAFLLIRYLLKSKDAPA
jgi:hypothetical protein